MMSSRSRSAGMVAMSGSPGGVNGGHQVASAWPASRPPSDSQMDSSSSVPAGWAALVRAARMSGTRMRLTAWAATSMALGVGFGGDVGDDQEVHAVVAAECADQASRMTGVPVERDRPACATEPPQRRYLRHCQPRCRHRHYPAHYSRVRFPLVRVGRHVRCRHHAALPLRQTRSPARRDRAGSVTSVVGAASGSDRPR
jgi:hypothetical protein